MGSFWYIKHCGGEDERISVFNNNWLESPSWLLFSNGIQMKKGRESISESLKVNFELIYEGYFEK